MEIKEQLDKIEQGVDKALEMQNEMEAMKKELETIKSVNIITGANKGMDNSKVKFWSDVRKKSINEYTAAEGGYTVPEEWYNEIIGLSNPFGKIRPLSKVIPMTTDTMNVQTMDAMTVGYISGSAATSENNIALTPYVLSLKKIGAALRFDNDFLQDVTPAKVKFIEEELMKGFSSWEDKAFLMGNGVLDATNGGISGVLNTSGVTAITMASSAFSGITADEIGDMIDAPTKIGANPKFVFDRSIRNYIRKLKHNSQYIWTPAGNGDVEKIWGYEVIWTNGSLPTATDTATGKAFGVFGSFDGLLIGDKGNIQVDMSTETAFLTNQTVLRAIRRLDARVIPAYFSVIKTKNS